MDYPTKFMRDPTRKTINRQSTEGRMELGATPKLAGYTLAIAAT